MYSQFHIPTGKRDFIFSPKKMQTSFGAHPASYSIGTMSSFSRGKAAVEWWWPPISI